MSASVHKVKRPDRWDQPYGDPLTDRQLLEVITHEPFSLVEPQNFPSNRPFEIVGVSMDDDGFDVVRPFADDLAVNYPIVLDNGALAEQFGGVYGLPTTFVVDENGMVTERFIGLFPLHEVKAELEALVERVEQGR